MRLLKNLIDKKHISYNSQLDLIESILYKSDVGYHQLDKDRNIITANKVWLDTLGYEREEVEGRPFADFLSEDFRKKFNMCFSSLPKNKVVENVSMELMHKNGFGIPVTFNSTMIVDDEGEISKTHALFRLDDSSMVNSILVEDMSALAESLYKGSVHESMSELLGAASAKWLEPLCRVDAALTESGEILNDDFLDKDALADNLTTCKRQVRELMDAMEAFKGFFSTHSAEPFRVADVILEVIDIYSRQFAFYGIDYEVMCDCSNSYFRAFNEIKNPECKEHPYMLRGDRVEFKRILMSVISNATAAVTDSLKDGYISRGLIRFVIKINSDRAEISVINNGRDIPDDVLLHVFEPYFSTKESGSGLGLFIVKSVVEKSLRGNIDMENTQDGVRTKITIPIMS